MILNPVLAGGAGGGVSPEELLPYLDGAHIEFAATEGDNTLHLRTQTAGYDCTIHWGDGSETVAPANGGKVIHDYAEAKTYHIFITGKSFAGFYVNNQAGSEKYVAVHSMGKWEVDTATNFRYCFYGCTNLTTLPADLFRYNTVATDFASCFVNCTNLTTLPADLFRYNTVAIYFGSCFEGCYSLTTLPADLFRYNTAAIDFTTCFEGCIRLTLRADIFGTDYTTRFKGKRVNFPNCFYRTVFSGTQGIAPALWSFTFGKVMSTGCFAGEGNSATSLSNYSSIPAAWK